MATVGPSARCRACRCRSGSWSPRCRRSPFAVPVPRCRRPGVADCPVVPACPLPPVPPAPPRRCRSQLPGARRCPRRPRSASRRGTSATEREPGGPPGEWGPLGSGAAARGRGAAPHAAAAGRYPGPRAVRGHAAIAPLRGPGPQRAAVCGTSHAQRQLRRRLASCAPASWTSSPRSSERCSLELPASGQVGTRTRDGVARGARPERRGGSADSSAAAHGVVTAPPAARRTATRPGPPSTVASVHPAAAPSVGARVRGRSQRPARRSRRGARREQRASADARRERAPKRRRWEAERVAPAAAGAAGPLP